MKPSDEWVIPMCHIHHSEQHRIGEKEFFGNVEKAKDLAKYLWKYSGDKMTCFLMVKRFK